MTEMGPRDKQGRPLPDPDLPDPGRYENRKVNMNKTTNPTSPKAWTAGVGGAIGAAVTAFLLWLIGAFITHNFHADGVDNALAAVPGPLATVIGIAVLFGSSFLGAYLKTDPERLPTLGKEQRQRVGLVGVDTRPRRAEQ